MKLEPQIKELCRQLRQDLEYFPAGSRFFSVRELADKYKCHRRIIDAALDALERQQLIIRMPRVGIFSNLESKQCKRRILLAMPDWPGEMIREWWTCAQQYVEKKPNWILRKTVIPMEQRIGCLDLSGCDCAIIQVPDAHLTVEDMRQIIGWQIPVVFLNVAAGSFFIATVNSDDSGGAMDACKFLFDRGHRRTAILIAEPHTYMTVNRVKSFCRAAGLLGMQIDIIDCDTPAGEFAPQVARTAVRQYLEEHDGKVDFTAMYTVSGEIALGAMQSLREYNYRLPEDISIISHSSEKIGEFYHPTLTAVCADLAAEVAVAFQGLEKILDGQIARFNLEVPMKLIERDSVKIVSDKP